jgi:hypothetical protein
LQFAPASGGGSSLTSPTGTGTTLSPAPLSLMLQTSLDTKTYGVFEKNFNKIPKSIEPMNTETINITLRTNLLGSGLLSLAAAPRDIEEVPIESRSISTILTNVSNKVVYCNVK